MPIHSGSSRVEQDRPGSAVCDGAVNGPPHRRRQWHQHEFCSLADHAEDSMAVFLTEVGDVGTGGFEDPQSEQA
jgi:hypothetical protein